MSTVYGSDTYCLSDVPLIDLQITDGKTLIGQRLGRRLTTPRGGLGVVSDDPDFGWDCRQYINKKLGPNELVIAQMQIEAECLKDEQVESCTATVSLAGTSLTIALQVQSSAGPFALTMNVASLTTDLVFNFQ